VRRPLGERLPGVLGEPHGRGRAAPIGLSPREPVGLKSARARPARRRLSPAARRPGRRPGAAAGAGHPRRRPRRKPAPGQAGAPGPNPRL
jgi:hypothetical protein